MEQGIPGPLPLPTGTWKPCPSGSPLPCNFICPGFQAPAVFVQIRVRLLYKPHWSFAGHSAAAPLTSPAEPLFAVSKQTSLTDLATVSLGCREGAAGSRKWLTAFSPSRLFPWFRISQGRQVKSKTRRIPKRDVHRGMCKDVYL